MGTDELRAFLSDPPSLVIRAGSGHLCFTALVQPNSRLSVSAYTLPSKLPAARSQRKKSPQTTQAKTSLDPALLPGWVDLAQLYKYRTCS